MPLVPHYPSDEPRDDPDPPAIDEIVDRILSGDGTSSDRAGR